MDRDREPAGPPRWERAGLPRWVRLLGIVLAILVLLAVIALLVSGGDHGPARH